MNPNIRRIKFKRGFHITAALLTDEFALYKEEVSKRFWFDGDFNEAMFQVALVSAKNQYDELMEQCGGNN